MILREIRNGAINDSTPDIGFSSHFELVVVGLGTAGGAALIAAARLGMNVLGVEQLYAMGGVGTIGGINGYYFGAKGGLYTEINEKAIALESVPFMEGCHGDTKSLVYDREARAAGAEVRYNSIVTGVYLDGARVCGLRILGEDCELHVSCDTVIDATSEAAVCFLAGCELQTGRDFDDQTQPFTYMSLALNEDYKRHGVNRDGGSVKQSDAREIAKASLHSTTFPFYQREDYTGYPRFIAFSPILGVREGRRIKARRPLRFIDVITGVNKRERELFYAFSNLDNHGKDVAMEARDVSDWIVACGLWGTLFSVKVPPEALIPEGMDNLMAVGRCMGVDHALAAAVRMKSDMEKSGEAAAHVCYEAVRNGKAVHNIGPESLEALEARLRATGCLCDANSTGFIARTRGPFDRSKAVETFLLEDAEAVLAELATDKPGWAIWSANVLAASSPDAADALIPALVAALDSSDELTACNAALALGLIGNEAAIPALREMAAKPDHYISNSGIKFVYTRGVSAIYLLGCIGDAGAVDMLLDALRNGVEVPEDFPFNELYCTPEDVHAQYTMYTIRALMDIARQHAPLRDKIAAELEQIIMREDFSVEVTLKSNDKGVHDLSGKVREYYRYRVDTM